MLKLFKKLGFIILILFSSILYANEIEKYPVIPSSIALDVLNVLGANTFNFTNIQKELDTPFDSIIHIEQMDVHSPYNIIFYKKTGEGKIKKSSADTCNGLYFLKNSGYILVNTHKNKDNFNTFDSLCKPLYFFKQAKPAQKSYLRNFFLTSNVMKTLPPLIFGGIATCRAKQILYQSNTQNMFDFSRKHNIVYGFYDYIDNKYTIIPFHISQDSPQGDAISFHFISNNSYTSHHYSLFNTNNENTVSVELLGRGDFTGDGWDKILLDISISSHPDDPMINGTNSTQYFLLTRKTPNGILEITHPEQYLCDKHGNLSPDWSEKSYSQGEHTWQTG